MKRLERVRWMVLAGVALASLGVEARAGLYDEIFRGLGYAVSPISAAPIPTVNGSRVGMMRIVPNVLGGGYRFEMNRNFGNDTFGRPEVYDAGPFQLGLNGSVGVTAQYTTRFFPIASANISATNLAYNLSGTTGVQDFTLTGTLNGTGNLEVNPLGFYTFNMNLSNTTSDLTLDGVGVDGDRDTDFDVGPISVKGNIYWDAVLGVLGTLGVDTSGLESVFPKSSIDSVIDDIQNSIDANSLFPEASGLPGDAVAKLRSEIASSLVGGIFNATLSETTSAFLNSGQQPLTVPEPATLLVLAVGGAAIFRRRIA